MNKLQYSIIKARDQYDSYCERVEYLTEHYKLENEDEIELLSYLIQKYNDEQTERYQLNLNPVQLLNELIIDNNLSQIALAKKIGVSPQLINDILKYRREITKKIALKLEMEFKIKFYAFLKPYQLQKAS